MGVQKVIVHPSRQSTNGGQPQIAADIEAGGRRYHICYRAAVGPLATGPEPFVAVALLPAMRLGAPLHVVDPVSPQLLQNLEEFQTIVATWYGELHHVAIEAIPASGAPASEQAATGSFFSGGVDSFYTALKHQQTISSLIFIRGMDIFLKESQRLDKIGAANRQAAAELGLPLLEVETNMRDLLDAYADWDDHSHGPALASVALALAPQFRTIYINSTAPYARMGPHGSQVLTDPLWSTEHLRIVHEGCECTRYEKIAACSGNATFQRFVRICFLHPEDGYNCGHCHHCLRMMAFVRSMGLAERFTTFPPLANEDVLNPVDISSGARRLHVRELVSALDRFGREPAIADVFRTALARYDEEAARERRTPQLREIQAQAVGMRRQLETLHASRSWKMTAPIRALERLLTRGGGQ
jgi:hypothetical protein